MNQEIALEVQKLLDVVKRRLDGELPEGVDVNLPLYSNRLSQKDVEKIRALLQAELAVATEVEGFEPLVVPGRPQDKNEAGSLIVTFKVIP